MNLGDLLASSVIHTNWHSIRFGNIETFVVIYTLLLNSIRNLLKYKPIDRFIPPPRT